MILEIIYYLLPAYFANMTPVFTRKILLRWSTPVDFNFKFLGKPLFGSHKTWKGLILGIIVAIIVALIQSRFKTGLEIYDYSSPILFGFLMGFGALFGDLVKSFAKRRIGIKSGAKWIPFDQLDFVIGALILTWPLNILSSVQITYALLISFVLHILVNHSAFYLKIRNEKW